LRSVGSEPEDGGRSVPKVSRPKSEIKSVTCLVVGTSQIGRTLISRSCSGADCLALSPPAISLLVEINSLFLLTGNLTLRLRKRVGISDLFR
jgi:hypothetical protein